MLKTLVIGPCAVENPQQLREISEAMKELVLPSFCGPIIFRAGIWKPRTSPNTFQGVGNAGLTWLKEIPFPVATEVATAEHIYACVKTHIDYCWLGTRTTINPIVVQELADTWQKISPLDRPKGIFIKNPMAQDVDLWIGAIDRLSPLNVPLYAVHRGVNHHPCWKMAFECHRQRPNIPLLLDPSHLSGDASQVGLLCQQALDLDFDGWMIEVHCHPDKALSDSKQQITPQQLQNILNGLVLPTPITEGQKVLKELRKQMDEVDDELWDIIQQRIELSQKIGVVKKKYHIPILQVERLQDILQHRLIWARERHIDTSFVEQLIILLHEVSIKSQI